MGGQVQSLFQEVGVKERRERIDYTSEVSKVWKSVSDMILYTYIYKIHTHTQTHGYTLSLYPSFSSLAPIYFSFFFFFGVACRILVP